MHCRVLLALLLLTSCRGAGAPADPTSATDSGSTGIAARTGTGTGTDGSGSVTVADADSTASSSAGVDLADFDVQGHRGDRGNVPPGNTVPSFESALQLGVDTLEGDLQITSDGEIVFGHDADLASTGCLWAGRGAAPSTMIAQITLAQVQQFDCHPELDGVQAPPDLATVVGLDAEVGLNLELKQLTLPAAQTYLQALVDHNATCAGCLTGRLTVQSFNPAAVEYAKTNFGDVLEFRGSVLTLGALSPDGLAAIARYAAIFSPGREAVTAALVDNVHAAGMQVLPWTVNDPAEMQAFIELGVDGLITDYPDILLRVLGR